MSTWHAAAHCANSACAWRHEQTGPAALAQHVDLAARKHEKAAQHATATSLHRQMYCKTLGCPPPPSE
jgi:hypothetical protein